MTCLLRAVLLCLTAVLCLESPAALAQENSLRQSRVLLFLRHTPAQETALHTLLGDLQDPHSASYHHWLTPEEYGRRFGATDAQIDRIRRELNARGLTLSKVHRSRLTFEVSGSTEQLRQSFATTITNSAGQSRLARIVPAEMKADIAGVVIGGTTATHSPQLNKLVYNRETHTFLRSATSTEQQGVGGSRPLLSTQEGGTLFYGITPGDLAVQYNLPSYAQGASTSINGYGSTVGIVSQYNVNLTYPSNYGNTFGITMPATHVVIDGNDPGVQADSLATYLEIEAIGSVAPETVVNIYTAADDGLQPGMDLALNRALGDNVVNVLLYPRQGCETYLDEPYDTEGDSEEQYINATFELASAQGITVVTPAGDVGSAACDQEYGSTASFGLAVNGFAASPYVTAVGGTDFYYGSQGTATPSTYAQYWSTSSSAYTTLLAPVPEQAWNDSNQATDQNAGAPYLLAGGGGVSAVGYIPEYVDSNGNFTGNGTPQPYPQPWWQLGIVPSSISGTARVTPDLSLFAGDYTNNSAYVFCADGTDCANTTNQSASNLVFTQGSGTEVSAAVFAGIMALVVGEHGTQGNVNPTLYAMSKSTPTAFHDIIYGTNAVACATGTANCTNGLVSDSNGQPAYPALAGYDAATGLGSVNGMALVQGWAPPNTSPSSTSLAIVDPSTGKALTSFPEGTAVNFNVAVSGSSSTPTGEVELLLTAPEDNNDDAEITSVSQGYGLLVNGQASRPNSTFLPGGKYQVYARYAGDAQYQPSLSAPITLNVSPGSCFLSVRGESLQSGASITYGTPVFISLEVRNLSGGNGTLASGAIVAQDNGATLTDLPIDSESVASLRDATFLPGSHQLGFTFGGDPTFTKCSTASTINFTVSAAPTTTTLTTSLANVPSTNGYYTLNAVVSPNATINEGTFPAGTVNFTRGDGKLIASVKVTGGVYANGMPSAQATTEPSGASLASGSNSITASFVPAASTGYAASTSNSVNVNLGSTAGLASSNLVMNTADGGNVYYDTMAGVTVNASVTGSGTPSGTVALYTNGVFVANMTSLGGGQWTYTFDSSTTPNYLLPLPIGNDTIMAQYSGDAANASDWANVNLTILDDQTHPDFSLLSTVDYRVVTAGTTSLTTAFQLMPIGGFTGTVYFGVSSPAGISCTVAGGGAIALNTKQYVSSTFTCTNLPTTPGTYSIDVIATTGLPNTTPNIATGIGHDLPIRLIVQ